MGPISLYPVTLYLCYKPVIRLVMFVLFLCGAPMPFSDEPIDLTVAGTTVTKSITIPVEMNYALQMTFEFPSVEARLADQIVGENYTRSCIGLVSHFDIPGIERIRYEDIPEIERSVLGVSIPFKVVVRSTTDRAVLVDQTFQSLCVTGHNGEKEKYRDIAWLRLPSGYYIAEITNLQEQSGLTGVKTTISFHGIQHN